MPATWPAPDYVHGEFLDYLDLRNRIKVNLDDLNTRTAALEATAGSYAKAYPGTGASVATSTWTKILLDTMYQQAGGWVITNNGLVVPAGYGGTYDLHMKLTFTNSANGIRGGQIRLNSGGAVGSGTMIGFDSESTVNGFDTTLDVFADRVSLAAADQIHMFGYQNNGSGLTYGVLVETTHLVIQRSR